MTMVFCEECGEKVSTDATTCPHCGRLRKGPKSVIGKIGEFFKDYGIILTVMGSVIAFLYSWSRDRDQAELSQETARRESKKAFLEFQLDTYKSVLSNISQLYTIYSLQDRKEEHPKEQVFGPYPTVDEGALIRNFIASFFTNMAVVEDRRTEFAMGIVNKAILAHQHAQDARDVDPKACSMTDTAQVLSHCIKMSIAKSWDFPADEQSATKDKFCNLKKATHFAEVCKWPLPDEARSEFQKLSEIIK